MATQEKFPTTWGERSKMRILNNDVPRIDGPLKVTGAAIYSHDIRLPGMLWARVLCCPFPVVHPTIDLQPALDVPGVAVAILLEDGMRDGWTRRLGQPIAAVAAETPEQAEDGLRAIAVEYEFGEWALDYDQATAEGAPPISNRGNVREGRSNGDEVEARAALEGCEHVVEATYTMPVHHHVCLETHGVVVDYTGGDEATVYASTQATFGVSGAAAKILELDAAKVTTVVEHMGGGFGAKFDLDVPGMIACLLAKEIQRPIHLLFKRSDEFLSAGNRSGGRQTLTGGVTADGKFKALVADTYRFGGLRGGAAAGQPYIYKPEVSFAATTSILTNTDGSRAMRAPGHPQSSFAIESMMDELAHAAGLDPLEFRIENLDNEVYTRQLRRVAKEIGWNEHANKLGAPKTLPERAQGIGFGVSVWGSGGRPACQVDVRVHPDGGVISQVGTQDIGTGTRTYVAGIVAEELGLELEQVEARIGNSNYGRSVGSGGSVTVPCLAPAIKDAAHKARIALFEHVAPLMQSDVADLDMLVGGVVVDREQSDKRVPWKELCSTLPPEGLEVRGLWEKDASGNLAANGVHGAQAARVEVDTLTGELRVIKMVCIQDIGLPLNRMALRSQINGAMIQALGYGLWEERLLDPYLGVQLNPGMEEYKVPGSMDIPELVSIIDDDDTRDAVLGVGEPPVIPGQSAIANAVFNACGVRVRDLPLSRDKIITGLAARG